uniref:Uncharacterized protein n=1 Tax=Knipowitschia caucasica TaxID=637954 RepID=A0AAV2KQ59_KNICA
MGGDLWMGGVGWGIDAFNQSKVVEILKDGGERRQRENGPQQGEGDDSAEWNGAPKLKVPELPRHWSESLFCLAPFG